MKNRTRQRENRRKKHCERSLDRRNDIGTEDMTACNAVNRFRSGSKAEIILRQKRKEKGIWTRKQ